MKTLFVPVCLLILALTALSYSKERTIKYPFTIRSVMSDVKEKTEKEFRSLNGEQWQTIMMDQFSGFLAYASVEGMPERKNLTDYKLAIKLADEFLKKNRVLLGIKEQLPKCINVRGNENPELGYVWVDYGGQIQHDMPVEGTRVSVKVDHPGVIKEIRCRWYPDIEIPHEKGMDKGKIKEILTGRSIPYKGYGGQALAYIVKNTDLTEEAKQVIFPLRKERENIMEFYITWKIEINKEELKSAWTLYMDIYSGQDIYIKQNFK